MTRTRAISTVQIDNDRIRVTRWHFAAGAETGWHRHAWEYVVVPLVTGPLLLEEPGGERRSELTAGQSYTRAAGIEHNVINPADSEFEFIELELKQV
jgi:beta-alanine degradation protein BauB